MRKIQILGLLLMTIMLLSACSGTNSTTYDKTPSISESVVSTPEPEPEKTPHELFLEAREAQGISEEHVQEVLAELREGKYLFFNQLTDDEQYVYAEEYIIATEFVTPENWENDFRKSDKFYLADLESTLTPENYSRIGLAFEWDQIELIYTNYLYLTATSGKYGHIGYVRWNSKYMESKESWALSKKVYEEELLSLEATADEMLKDMPDGDDYEKVKYIFKAVADRYTYEKEGPRYIYDTFAENKTQCEGYAKTFAYLARRAGFEVAYMEGSPTDQFGDGVPGHAWNILKMDGDYYYLDCTWADNEYGTLYYYLGMNDEQFKNAGHPTKYPYALIINGQGGKYVNTWEILPVPECTATADSFMCREGFIVEEFSEATLKNALEGKNEVQFCFTNPEVGKAVYEYLIENKNICKYWKKTRYSYSYSLNFIALCLKKTK